MFIKPVIDFSINGLSTEIRLRSPQRIPKPYKIKVKNCKLIDLVIRSELTLAILMLWFFLNFLRNSIIYFGMFLYLVTYFLRVTGLLLYAGYKPYHRYMLQFNPTWLVKRVEIVRPCDRHSIETVTIRKHVTKYKTLRKLLVEFLKKIETRAIKSEVLYSYHQNLSIYSHLYFNFARCWGSVVILTS